MKKFWKYIAACAVVASLVPLTACDDNDTVDPYDINYCYFYQPDQDYSNLEFKVSGVMLNDLDEPVQLVPVRLTKAATSNVTVEIALDPTLVDEYNSENGTDCAYFSTAKLVNTTLTIPQGEYLSTEMIQVNLEDKSCLEHHEGDMVLPIVIKSVNGVNAQISKRSRMYMVFKYSGNTVSAEPMTTLYADLRESGWESALTNSVVDNFLTAEWAAEYPVSVKAEIDNSLIAVYNNTNSTNYQAISATVTSPVTIAVGATNASLKLRIGDYTGVANGTEYMIPVKLSMENGEGAVLGTEVAYVVVKKLPMMLTCSTNLPTGWVKMAPECTCSLTVTDDGVDYDISTLLTNTNTSGYGGDFLNTGYLITLDLGSIKTVAGFHFSFYAWYYALKSIDNIQISNDGQTWSDVIGLTMGQYKSVYAEFLKPTAFRYFRFVAGDYSYSSYYGCYMNFLNVYSK